jgi:hypothetical protein
MKLPAAPLRTTERDEELLTPIVGILGVFVVLAVAERFTGEGFNRLFPTPL